MRAQLPLRLARSAAFTVVCLTLAALGHRAAGGSGPAWWALATGGIAVTAVTVVLAGTERPAQTIMVLLGSAQVLLHQLFALSGAGGSALRFHLSHGRGFSADLGMIITHLTATLITGWWLARGESALWSVLRRVGARTVRGPRRLLALLDEGPAAPKRPAAGAPRHLPPVPARRELRHTVHRRGPPLPAGF